MPAFPLGKSSIFQNFEISRLFKDFTVSSGSGRMQIVLIWRRRDHELLCWLKILLKRFLTSFDFSV